MRSTALFRLLQPAGRCRNPSVPQTFPEVGDVLTPLIDIPDVRHKDTQVLHYFPAHDSIGDYETAALQPVMVNGVPFHFFIATPWVPESALAVDRLFSHLQPQAVMVDEEQHPHLFSAAHHVKASHAPCFDPQSITPLKSSALREMLSWLGPALPYFATHEMFLATSFLPFHAFALATSRALQAGIPYFRTRSAAGNTQLKLQRARSPRGSLGDFESAVRAAFLQIMVANGHEYAVEAAESTASVCATRAVGYAAVGVAGPSTLLLRVQDVEGGGGWRVPVSSDSDQLQSESASEHVPSGTPHSPRAVAAGATTLSEDDTPEDLLPPVAAASVISEDEARDIDAAHFASASVDMQTTVDGQSLSTIALRVFNSHFQKCFVDALMTPSARQAAQAAAQAHVSADVTAAVKAVDDVAHSGVAAHIQTLTTTGLYPLTRHQLGGREWVGTRISPTADPPPGLAEGFLDTPENAAFRKDRDAAIRLMGSSDVLRSTKWKAKPGRPVLVVMSPCEMMSLLQAVSATPSAAE